MRCAILFGWIVVMSLPYAPPNCPQCIEFHDAVKFEHSVSATKEDCEEAARLQANFDRESAERFGMAPSRYRCEERPGKEPIYVDPNY
jgi:hypothetical protein